MIPLYSDAFPQSTGLYDSASSYTSTSVHPPLIHFQSHWPPYPSWKMSVRLLLQNLGNSFTSLLGMLSLDSMWLTLLFSPLTLSPSPHHQISAWPSQNTWYKIAFTTHAPNLPYSTLFSHIVCITTSYCIYLHVQLFIACNLKVSSVRTWLLGLPLYPQNWKEYHTCNMCPWYS